MKKHFLALATSSLLTLFSIQSALADQTIWLVRHAEKAQDGTNDPDLTAKGQARATWFKNFFNDKNIAAVYSTSYKRTYNTVKPTADAKGLVINTYDPTKLDDLVKAVEEGGQDTLIGGHSNVTPPTVNAFMGTNLPDLEDHQYDRIYKVVITDDGQKYMEIMFSEPRTPDAKNK